MIDDSRVIHDGVLREVDPRYVVVERITSWIVTASVSVGLAVGITIAVLVAPMPTWSIFAAIGVWVAITGLLAWLSEGYPRWAHRFRRYKVTPTGIEIRGGIVWRFVTTVPRSRIQHIDVSRGPLMRRYDLAHLVIHTAGTEHALVELPGLAHDTALGVRDYLIDSHAGAHGAGGDADVV